MSNAFRKRGHECFTVDWNEKFPSSLHIDIEKLTVETILEKFGQPDVVWIGTDCTSYSIAAISHHRKKNPTTGNLDPISDYAKKCDRMNQHVKQLVKQLNPKLYFWENPRAGLRKMSWMQDMPRYTISYCKYETDKPASERRMKPTDIWTNHPNPKFKPMCHNGNPDHAPAPRGSKTGTQGMKNAEERSMYPKLLCEHIVDICEEYMCEENLFDECKSCKNKYSSMECDMCENFDMHK